LLDVDALVSLAERASRAEEAPAPPSQGPKHVLVVEDAPVARELLAGVLRSLGYRVSEALDGRQGLSMVRDFRPDLVLTDLEMPFLDGLDMVSRIRDEPDLASTPIVVLTTRDDPDTRVRAETLGVRAFLSKQRFVEEELRAVIESVLGR
jgi:two-component system chemotaxis sensor kinase CheA